MQPPPEKSHPPLSQQPHCKNWGPVKPSPFENWVEGSTPQQKGGEGAHYETDWLFSEKDMKKTFLSSWVITEGIQEANVQHGWKWCKPTSKYCQWEDTEATNKWSFASKSARVRRLKFLYVISKRTHVFPKNKMNLDFDAYIRWYAVFFNLFSLLSSTKTFILEIIYWPFLNYFSLIP